MELPGPKQTSRNVCAGAGLRNRLPCGTGMYWLPGLLQTAASPRRPSSAWWAATRRCRAAGPGWPPSSCTALGAPSSGAAARSSPADTCSPPPTAPGTRDSDREYSQIPRARGTVGADGTACLGSNARSLACLKVGTTTDVRQSFDVQSSIRRGLSFLRFRCIQTSTRCFGT